MISCNTAFTADMLHVLVHCVQKLNQNALRVLEALNQTAESIIYARRCENIEPEKILNGIRPMLSQS
jgi:hypothetical protein